ncbi:DUF721 domain-containing protein [Micromonospora carbonacea]|uniref:DUF721 domain-containing protein n=1 Tax=Micromonospora carbonacea TaxID=47853 RepID=A0A7H8XE68_9ACTN|nr:DciA family protein [Micromonospora carbonacea]MBB5829798.1 putative nucleic acid-binding Zn ribbon protein [Micromonospora carbonacea]QLD22830.1 DUF721 domain-containing protein [Micromonospora carbonacea]
MPDEQELPPARLGPRTPAVGAGGRDATARGGGARRGAGRAADGTGRSADPAAEGGGDAPAGAAGPELARAVLDAARARREAAAKTRRRSVVSGDGEGGRRLRGYSGPGPDPRDPQPLGVVLGRLMKARGWEQPAAEATVFGAWERVVGPEVAQNSRPVKLEDGELTVEARSTAWATQLRLLAASLLRQIASEVGHNVVRKLHIHGPAAPSWSRGPRRVRGRGPRDTYG